MTVRYNNFVILEMNVNVVISKINTDIIITPNIY